MQLDAPVERSVTPCCCLDCRSQVWAWAEGRLADGRALTFDLVGTGDHRMLMVHDCGDEDENDGFWDLEGEDGP